MVAKFVPLFGVLICLLEHNVVRVGGKCTTVVVKGSLYRSDTEGIYYRGGNSFCNSRNIWVQETGDHFLYYIQDGYDGWFIGPWSCQWGSFFIASKSLAEEPYDVKETWKEYVEATALWQNNSIMQVQCYDGEKYNNEFTNCQELPCLNGGSCENTTNRYECLCPHKYYGRSCETKIDINHCKSSPCQNGASCHDLDNDFECKCQPGFSGRQCDIAVDPSTVDCALQPCNELCKVKTGHNCQTPTAGSEVLRVLMFLGMALCGIGAIILVLFVIVRCAKQYCASSDESSTDCTETWKDISYAKLENEKSQEKPSFA